jgi:replicative DNA helicase
MTPPNDTSAEQALLGALLLGVASETDAADVYASLPPQAFYRSAHGSVFAACRDLYESQIEVDELTVVDRLRSQGELERAGGATEVCKLANAIGTGANLKHYARIVRDLWLRRRLIIAAQEAVSAAYDLETPVGQMLDQVAGGVSEIALTGTTRAEPRTMAALVREKYAKLRAAAESPEERTGVPTGIFELDEMLGGMMPGQLILIAGRPSMGKTALAMGMARHAALKADTTTLVFSLEMEQESLVDRELAAVGHVHNQALRKPQRLSSDEWSRLADAAGKLDSKRLLVLDTPDLTVLDIRAQARLTKARHGLGAIFIDYLGLIRPVQRESQRDREVSEISKALKNLAKELRVPVVCLAQLNRQLEQRESKRPKQSDLRDSGSLEQDADVILFAHRPAYFDAKLPADVAEVVVGKQRNGPTGVVEVGWDGRFVKFYNRTTAGEGVGR